MRHVPAAPDVSARSIDVADGRFVKPQTPNLLDRRLGEHLVNHGGVERDTIERFLRLREIEFGVDEYERAVICRVGLSRRVPDAWVFLRGMRVKRRPRKIRSYI